MKTYKKYGLFCNPFHPAGLPMEQDILWASRYKLKLRLKDVIKRIIRSRKSECVIINGDYGSGKSHTLLYFNENINNGEFGEDIISIYVKNPGRGLMDFYRYLISALGFSRISVFAKELIGMTLSKRLRHINSKSKYVNYAETLKKYTKIFSPEFLSDKIARAHFLSHNFASALTFLGLELHPEVAWKWLTGTRLGPHEMRKIDVMDSLVTTEHIEEAICSIINLLHECKYKVTFIMLDEVEDLLNIKDEAARAEYLRSIRRIIDYNPTGLGLFFACTEDGWREILLNYQPLASRLARGNFMQLFNLTFDETKQFIIDYLSPYRVRNATPAEFPFEEASLKLIHEYSSGIPREIVKACALSIEHAFNKGSQSITDDIVREALSSG